jgi:hypothetical protein
MEIAYRLIDLYIYTMITFDLGLIVFKPGGSLWVRSLGVLFPDGLLDLSLGLNRDLVSFDPFRFPQSKLHNFSIIIALTK